MPKQSTVSTWLVRLQGQSDDLSAQKLWDRVSPRIQVLSRRLIQRFGADAIYDEEDITVCVFSSLFSGLQTQQFPNLLDSEGLWKLMTLMTVRKVRDYTKQRQAIKRNSGSEGDETSSGGIERCADEQQEPSFDVMMADQCRMMLNQLDDPILEQVVLLRLDGYTNDEIAELLQYSRRSIQRMLKLVKDMWSCYVDP